MRYIPTKRWPFVIGMYVVFGAAIGLATPRFGKIAQGLGRPYYESVAYQQLAGFPLVIALCCARFPDFRINAIGILCGCFIYGQCVLFTESSVPTRAIACNGLPFAWALYLVLSGAMILMIRRWRRVGPYPIGQCSKCGYPSRELPGPRCPECGSP